DLIGRVKFREDTFASNVKFRRASLDRANADYSLGVGRGDSAEKLAVLQKEVDTIKADVDGLTANLERTKTHRLELEQILGQITAEHAVAEKKLKDHEGKLAQLQKTLAERAPNLGKSFLEMPVVDAFGGPIK